MLGNIVADESPDFYQLNLGRRLTASDAVSVELITWRYFHPLGVPYGSSFGADSERYPGYVRSVGAGVAYQRILWRGLYAAGHVAALRQQFRPDGNASSAGFQLFTTARVGYQINLFEDWIFIEPSVAVTAWPIATRVPQIFRERDARWPRHFLGEPGLHFGIRF